MIKFIVSAAKFLFFFSKKVVDLNIHISYYI